MPKGRTQPVIYVVEVAAHQGVSKIGRTHKWSNRRKNYATWNLASGNGILRERVFTIMGEYVDLAGLERAILSACPYPTRFGSEWFSADFDDACMFVEAFLSKSGLDYE